MTRQDLSARIENMDDLLTVSEVAKLLRVDNTTVRRWVKQETLEAIVLPHMKERQAYRIKKETVLKMLGVEGIPTRRTA
jgi:excisionase family DNA binding protein